VYGKKRKSEKSKKVARTQAVRHFLCNEYRQQSMRYLAENRGWVGGFYSL